MKKCYLTQVFLYGTLLLASAVHADTFCVTTTQELYDALETADSNGQSDVIRIAEGAYTVSGEGFNYESSESFDIDISGGWSAFFGNPCGQQLPGGPFVTQLNGDDSFRVLRIRPGLNADISVSRLYFVSGFVDGPGARGGGLDIFPPSGHSGAITIENNAFISNTARFGGALNVSRGTTIRIRNNLFAANHGIAGSNIDIVQNTANGVYFTNNTVYANTTGSTSNLATGGVYVAVSDSSQAFIANNLMWENEAHDLRMAGDGYIYLRNNDFDSRIGVGPDDQSNNISEEPLFEPGILNFTPSLASPLINKGTNPPAFPIFPIQFDDNWSLGDHDLLGNPRFQDGRVEIGAYEADPEEPIFENGFEIIL